MQKTFCDRCGTECKNYVLNLSGGIAHYTSQGEHVGYDEMTGIQLCKHCADVLLAELPMKLRDEFRDRDAAELRERPLDAESGILPCAPVRFTVTSEEALLPVDVPDTPLRTLEAR